MAKNKGLLYTALVTAAAIALTVTLLVSASVNSIKVFASGDYISLSAGLNTAHKDVNQVAEIPGYYYLSTWTGAGTSGNPFKPYVAATKEVQGSKLGWTALDLRPNPTLLSGYCLVFTDVPVTNTTDYRLLSTSKDSDIEGTALSALKAVTGAGDITATKLSDVIFQLLSTPNKRANICNPVQPDQDGKYRIYLGNQIYGDPPPELKHGTITESFNKGDSTTLGPDQTWTEVDGTAWTVTSNQAYVSGAREERAYPSPTFATTNHYTQATVVNIVGNESVFYLLDRWDGAVLASSNHYQGAAITTSGAVKRHAIEKVVAGVYSSISTIATTWTANEVLRFDVSGSSLNLKKDGSSIGTATDTSITSGSYGGIGYYSGAGGNSVTADVYSASDLYTAGFPYVVNTSQKNENSDGTNHTLTLPSSVVSGNLLLCIYSVDGNPTCTINGGWSKLGQDSNSTVVTGAVFYKVATGSDSANITTTASERGSMEIYQIGGASGTVYGASANGSSTNSNPPSLNSGSSQKYLWFATRSGDSTVQATVAPTNYQGLLLQGADGTSGASTASAWRENETQTEDPGTFTSATEQWVSWTIAVAPTVTETVNYSASQADYGFGVIQPNSTTNTTADWILFTNSSSVSTNISVRMLASTWGSGGSGWTHSDSAAGANTAAMKAASGNTSTWATAVFIKYNTAYNEIAQSVAASSNYVSGLSLLAPTSFTDGYSNNNTVRFNFYAASP